MSTRKYYYEPMTKEQIETLEAKFPKAVEVVKRLNYGIIAKLLDCGVEVPGLVLRDGPVGDEAEEGGEGEAPEPQPEAVAGAEPVAAVAGGILPPGTKAPGGIMTRGETARKPQMFRG